MARLSIKPAKKSKRRRSDSHESTLTTQVRYIYLKFEYRNVNVMISVLLKLAFSFVYRDAQTRSDCVPVLAMCTCAIFHVSDSLRRTADWRPFFHDTGKWTSSLNTCAALTAGRPAGRGGTVVNVNIIVHGRGDAPTDLELK